MHHRLRNKSGIVLSLVSIYKNRRIVFICLVYSFRATNLWMRIPYIQKIYAIGLYAQNILLFGIHTFLVCGWQKGWRSISRRQVSKCALMPRVQQLYHRGLLFATKVRVINNLSPYLTAAAARLTIVTIISRCTGYDYKTTQQHR